MVTNGSEGVKDKADGGGSVFFLDSPSHPNIRSHSSSKIKSKGMTFSCKWKKGLVLKSSALTTLCNNC